MFVVCVQVIVLVCLYVVGQVLGLQGTRSGTQCSGPSIRPWLVLVGLHGTCSASEGSSPGIPTIPLLIANFKCTDHSPPISSTALKVQWCEQKLESMHITLCTRLRFLQFETRLVSCNFTSTNENPICR